LREDIAVTYGAALSSARRRWHALQHRFKLALPISAPGSRIGLTSDEARRS
jgi:hypothetical protein